MLFPIFGILKILDPSSPHFLFCLGRMILSKHVNVTCLEFFVSSSLGFIHLSSRRSVPTIRHIWNRDTHISKVFYDPYLLIFCLVMGTEHKTHNSYVLFAVLLQNPTMNFVMGSLQWEGPILESFTHIKWSAVWLEMNINVPHTPTIANCSLT